MPDSTPRPRRSNMSPAPCSLNRTFSSSLRQYGRPPFLRQKSSPKVGSRTQSRSRSQSQSQSQSYTRSYGTLRRTSQIVPEEQESLLAAQNGNNAEDEEHELEAQASDQADSDGLYPPNCCWTSNTVIPRKADPFRNADCAVWSRIHEIRLDIIDSIDDPYSLEQLKAPRMNIAIVRPLVNKFYETQDLSIVYCLLINRTQFIREQSYATHHQTVNLTRALLCEILAEKILRRYNEHNPGPLGLLKLANILVAGFEPFQGAPEEVIKSSSHAMHWAHQRKGMSSERKMTALEIALVSESKSFLANSACQKVVDAIYRGKIVYTPTSFIDIIPDHWKRRPISLYDPRRGPWLNQYRLIVPRTRNMLEVIQFVILLVLYMIVMSGRETRRTTKFEVIEAVFDVYAGGWVLDQVASVLEHGWQVYTQNLWAFLDVMFSLLFISYFIVRMHALNISDSVQSDLWSITALDILSCAAPVLIPRLAFNLMSENMLFLSLRAMMGDFLTLTGLAIWCFAGFLLSLKWLHNGLHHTPTIGKWMIWIWFGLDGTGIDRAPEFHSFLGPVLMITFAFLGNTLFLTILVSMLTNTFSMIATNAVQEIQYRKSVLTFMGVKSDAIFAYPAPFNLVALVVLIPAKFILSPRLFHTINVSAVKVLNLPLLLCISLYERRTLWTSDRFRPARPRRIDWKGANGPRALNSDWWSQKFQFWDFSRFSVHGDIQAVFDTEPPEIYGHADTSDEDMVPPTGREQNFRTSLQDSFSPDRGLGIDTETTAVQVTKSKPESPTSQRSKKEIRKDDALRKEFFDSEEEHHTGEDSPIAHSKLKKKTGRKDSLIDYDTANPGTQETNARLHKLEQSVEKIEMLLMQLLHSGDGDDEGEDDVDAQNELRRDVIAEEF